MARGEFYDGNLLLKQSGEIPVAIPRFLLREKRKRKHCHSSRRGFVFLTVISPLFIPHNGNFVMLYG